MKFLDYVGEATQYDKKRSVERKKIKSWLKSISAFANTEGGVLIFGVDNNDEIVGLENAKEDAEFISQKIKERISVFPSANLKFEQYEDKTVLFVYVPKGHETPYYYSGDGVTEAYIRIGNESVAANAIEIKRLVMRGQNTTYDSIISSYKAEDYAFSKLRERYRQWTGKSMEEKVFASFYLVNRDGYLTNAGALVADDSPIRWSRLFCTRWNGLNKSGGRIDALDSMEYTGSIISLLQEGIGFVRRNMRKMWRKTSNSRIEMPDYSERGVFEALVNALVHRDYMIMGSEVHIDIFDDRMVIYSPGGMVDGVEIQDRDISNVPSIRRNPVLADVFDRLGYMERQGSGLGKIREAYISETNYSDKMEPIFYSDRSQFTVTLSNLNYETPLSGTMDGALNGALNGALRDKISEEEIHLLEYISKKADITQKELAEEFKCSRRIIQRMMKKLQDKGVLERIGGKKSGRWIVLYKK